MILWKWKLKLDGYYIYQKTWDLFPEKKFKGTRYHWRWANSYLESNFSVWNIKYTKCALAHFFYWFMHDFVLVRAIFLPRASEIKINFWTNCQFQSAWNLSRNLTNFCIDLITSIYLYMYSILTMLLFLPFIHQWVVPTFKHMIYLGLYPCTFRLIINRIRRYICENRSNKIFT